MELLLSGFRSQIEQIVPRSLSARGVYLCPVTTIDELPGKISTTARNFVLLLACNAESLRGEEIEHVASKLVEQGLAYFCAWGSDCERVHDLFDAAAQGKNEQLVGEDVVMTTSHKDESLLEALWFFLHSAFPTRYFETSCTDWVIAVVGNPAWEEEIRTKIMEAAFEPPSE